MLICYQFNVQALVLGTRKGTERVEGIKKGLRGFDGRFKCRSVVKRSGWSMDHYHSQMSCSSKCVECVVK